MDLKLYVLYLLVSLAYTYEHRIVVSKGFQLAQCDKVNRVLYKCSSLYQAFQQLSTCCNSTDVIIVEPGSYPLNVSYTFKYLTDIRLSSDRS